MRRYQERRESWLTIPERRQPARTPRAPRTVPSLTRRIEHAAAPAGEQEAAQGRRNSDEAQEQPVPSEELKVVVYIKGGRATIGAGRPSADPHIESFDELDLSGLAQEALAVVERARVSWEETPKYPAYERPAPPARGRNRRRQGANQTEDTEAETEQAQQRDAEVVLGIGTQHAGPCVTVFCVPRPWRHYERPLYRQVRGSLPGVGDRVWIDSCAYPGEPHIAHGTEFQDMGVPAAFETIPAWLTTGESDTTAILLRGHLDGNTPAWARIRQRVPFQDNVIAEPVHSEEKCLCRRLAAAVWWGS